MDRRHHCNSVTSHFARCLHMSVESLKNLAIEYQQVYGMPFGITSLFQTLVVENFSSIIRRKCHHPNLWLYTVYEQRAWMELIKRLSPDCPFLMANKEDWSSVQHSTWWPLLDGVARKNTAATIHHPFHEAFRAVSHQ